MIDIHCGGCARQIWQVRDSCTVGNVTETSIVVAIEAANALSDDKEVRGMVIVVVQSDGPDGDAVWRCVKECDSFGDIGPIIGAIVSEKLLTCGICTEKIKITIGVVINGGYSSAEGCSKL